MGPTWSPPGSCRPQMCPMLAPWTLLSGLCYHLFTYQAVGIEEQDSAPHMLLQVPSFYLSLSKISANEKRHIYGIILSFLWDLGKVSLFTTMTNKQGARCFYFLAFTTVDLSAEETWIFWGYYLNTTAANGLVMQGARSTEFVKSLSSMKKDFNYLCHLDVENYRKSV